MFHGLCKGLFGCAIELKLAQNPVLPFLPWKEKYVAFSERIKESREWHDMEEGKFSTSLSLGLRTQNILCSLQGSFWPWYKAKTGPKPSFAIFAIERRLSRVFGNCNRSSRPTWHGSSALIVMSITSITARKGYLTFPSVSLAEK